MDDTDLRNRPRVAALPPLRREQERRRRLSVMRRWATGMLAAATALWVLLLVARPAGTWPGYAMAAIEASMVGALADWFAVTALFRHPLGIPIPHTAIVVERKDQFGKTLAEFFRENFLSGAAVAHRMRTSGTVVRAATWAADGENAVILARHLLRHLAAALDATGDGLARSTVQELRQLVAHTPAAPVGAAALRAASTSAALDDAIDAACVLASRTLRERHDELESMFMRDRPWWLPELVGHRLLDHLVGRIDTTVREVGADRSHPLREVTRSRLLELAERVEHDHDTAERLESFKGSLVHDDRVADALTSVFARAMAHLREDSHTPGSPTERRLVSVIQQVARQVLDDPDLRLRIEASVESVVDQVTSIVGEDIDALVTGTIAHWDAARTSDQLELLLGPDLQYIRINGTIVGALAGLLIYTIAQVAG